MEKGVKAIFTGKIQQYKLEVNEGGGFTVSQLRVKELKVIRRASILGNSLLRKSKIVLFLLSLRDYCYFIYSLIYVFA